MKLVSVYHTSRASLNRIGQSLSESSRLVFQDHQYSITHVVLSFTRVRVVEPASPMWESQVYTSTGLTQSLSLGLVVAK
jgi:hypothetical protein